MLISSILIRASEGSTHYNIEYIDTQLGFPIRITYSESAEGALIMKPSYIFTNYSSYP
jgi:hypothetical protein